ncbi:hypothetical protein PENTCL1PPCAC_7589, partial [Pristionchus entomophagus]
QFIRIPSYPNTRIPGVDVSFQAPAYSKIFSGYDDKVHRAVVRRGCMATFWSSPLNKHIAEEMKLLRNAEYGDYSIPTGAEGSIEVWVGNGLSRVSCYCDPFETEKEKPAKTKCVEYHE